MLIAVMFSVLVLVLIGLVIIGKLYVKTPANMSFIRTGLGGKKVVIDKGVVVWPIVQNIQWLSLETIKLEVFKANREAFITKDRFRVDIGGEFYVKIEPDENAIERASRSLGDRSFSPEGIKALLEEKLISALRSEVAQRELVELHENRRHFASAVMATLEDVIRPNGLTLEDVSIYYLDQTERDQLDPNNVFDAEGLRQITAQTSERMRERNEIERNTEVALKRKDVEAVRLKLALDQEKSFAEMEQARQIEMDRAKKRAEINQLKYEQERIAKEAEIGRDRAIRGAEISKEAYLIQKAKEREEAEIEKARAIEEALREKEKAIILKEVERIKEDLKRLGAEAEKEKAAQLVVTAQERVKAEREKEIALIEAKKILEVAENRAKTTETLAKSRRVEGEAEAYANTKLKEAENVLDEKIVQRDIALELIARAPQILSELMAPAQNIEGIKVLHIDGLGNGGGTSSGIDGVIGSFLKAGAAMPLLKELLDFSRIDKDALKNTVNQIPGLREAIALKE